MQTKTELQYPAQAMFVVPKRIFKKAHDRNKLKRRMREAYRLNKEVMYAQMEDAGTRYILAFIYTGKKSEEYRTIEDSVLKLVKNLLKKN